MTLWMEKSGWLSRVGKGLVIALITFVMIFPFIYIISVSFSSYKDVAGRNLVLIPANPTISAYKYVFDSGIVVRALGISVFITVVGTFVNLALTVTMAYGLSRKGVP